jgi:hypothetical protein
MAIKKPVMKNAHLQWYSHRCGSQLCQISRLLWEFGKFPHNDILAPNDAISLVNANLDGRFFGGDSFDMQIVSGDHINSPAPTPEPSTLILLASALLGFVGLATWRKVRLA